MNEGNVSHIDEQRAKEYRGKLQQLVNQINQTEAKLQKLYAEIGQLVRKRYESLGEKELWRSIMSDNQDD